MPRNDGIDEPSGHAVYTPPRAHRDGLLCWHETVYAERMSDLANPYAAPKAQDRIEDLPAEDLVDASRGQRLVNLIIDYIARGLLGMALSFVLVGLRAPLHEYLYLYTFGFTLLTYVGYYVLCEWLFGFTIGKLITRTRVVSNDGRKPRFMQILGRSLARFVPFEPFSFFNTPAVGWHDRWSGTRVIKTR
jgi:uncharacterized RDD family membrane protein YckC